VQRTLPRTEELGQAVEWLLDHRIGAGWGSSRATAAAVRALGTWVGEAKLEPQKFTVELLLNGKPLRKLAADGMKATVRIEADPAQLQDSNRLDLKLEGRGEVAYTATLEGITDGVPPADEGKPLQVKRRYAASPLLFDGVAIPRGFATISGEHKAIENPVDELPVGTTCDVTLEVHTRDKQRYLVVEDFVPAGTSVVEATVSGGFDRFELCDGKDYVEKKHTLALAEVEKPGAYLIVCKAEELECSGMLLVSELRLQVQEDPKSGRVRVTARDADGKYKRKVYVKIVGSAGDDFRSGRTDLRGVFEATKVRGLATVIAREGDHYAFHRGLVPLMMDDKQYTIQYRNGRIVVVNTPEVAKQLEAQPAPEPAASDEQAELGNVKARLRSFQGKAGKVWQDQTRSETRGVAVQAAQ